MKPTTTLFSALAAALLSARVAHAGPPAPRPPLGQTSEWLVSFAHGASVGADGLGLPLALETQARFGHLFVGGDLTLEPRIGGSLRTQAGAWGGPTFGDVTRWEIGAGAGWHDYTGVGRRWQLLCDDNDPGASGSSGYVGERVGVRWRGHNRGTWTAGLWLYATQDLSRRSVSYSYRTSSCLFGGSGSTQSATQTIGEVQVGLVARVGFSLGQ